MSEPRITIRAAHDSGRGNLVPTRYVIHATAGGRGYPRESAPGTARATAQYFTHASAGGSAHYIHDAGGDEEHCVPDDTIAWHAPPNELSLGDEICAEPSYTREQWLSPEVWPAVQAAARRCRDRCDHYGIPKVKLSPADLLAGKHGICGHVDVSNAWHQSTHWDPGPNFPWDRFMAEVLGQTPTPAPPPVEDDMPQTFQTVDTHRSYVADWLNMWQETDKEVFGSYVASSGPPHAVNQRQADVLRTRKAALRAEFIADMAKTISGGKVDEKALAASLTPALVSAIVAALPGDGDGPVDVNALAAKVVDDLAARIAS